MNMFCYQCQEAAGNSGCTKAGVCGKKPETAALQDLLIFVSKGVAIPGSRAVEGSDDFLAAVITNVGGLVIHAVIVPSVSTGQVLLDGV